MTWSSDWGVEEGSGNCPETFLCLCEVGHCAAGQFGIIWIVPRKSSVRLQPMNAIDIECPQCGANAGERCHTLTGKANPVSHAKRKLAAFEADASREEEAAETVKVAGPTAKS